MQCRSLCAPSFFHFFLLRYVSLTVSFIAHHYTLFHPFSAVDNPNEAVAPDFTNDTFIDQCQTFMDLGLTDQQAADALKNVWNITTTTARLLGSANSKKPPMLWRLPKKETKNSSSSMKRKKPKSFGRSARKIKQSSLPSWIDLSHLIL